MNINTFVSRLYPLDTILFRYESIEYKVRYLGIVTYVIAIKISPHIFNSRKLNALLMFFLFYGEKKCNMLLTTVFGLSKLSPPNEVLISQKKGRISLECQFIFFLIQHLNKIDVNHPEDTNETKFLATIIIRYRDVINTNRRHDCEHHTIKNFSCWTQSSQDHNLVPLTNLQYLSQVRFFRSLTAMSCSSS